MKPILVVGLLVGAVAGVLLAQNTKGPQPPAKVTYMSAEQIAEALEPDTLYDVEIVDCVSLENTVGATGGTVMDPANLRSIRAVTDAADVPIHLDGARLFNAAAAAGVDATAWTSQVATVSFCLSKGLGAPIGSMLCGPAEQIREALTQSFVTPLERDGAQLPHRRRRAFELGQLHRRWC